MEREKCIIKVAVLDLTKMLEDAKVFRAKKHKSITSVTTEKWGLVTTKKGVFAVNIEGVGPDYPITNDDFLTLQFYGTYEKDGDQQSFDMLPFATLAMDLEELQKCPIIEEKPLHEFIRTFGDRLELNYKEWKKTLED